MARLFFYGFFYGIRSTFNLQDTHFICTFTLPMSDSQHTHTILYAEDDADDLYMVSQAFQQFDGSIRLLHAQNGFETLKQLDELKSKGIMPCLVILDINMPGMDGKEALIRIKQSEEYKHIPAILFTTSSSNGDKKFAEIWGAYFITKPIMYDELETLAKTFVGHCESEVSKRA